MLDPLGNERLFGFLRTALDASSVRTQVVSGNIANLDTPGYKAKDIDFDQIMKDYMGGTETPMPHRPDGRIIHREQGINFANYNIDEPEDNITQRFDGNNVDLDKEVGKLAAAQGRYNLALRFVERKVRLLNEAYR